MLFIIREALKVNGLCVVADRTLGGVLLFCLTSKPECLALQLGHENK